MTWRIYLVETTTGIVGRALDVAAYSWEDVVNGAGGGSATVKKTELAGLARERYSPGWGSLVACYVHADGTEVPWVGGPITGWSSETRHGLTLSWEGLWGVFEGRLVEKDLAFRGSTYGQIAWELAEHGMLKPGGALPLVHGSPVESALRERTYERWNLSNNAIAKRWTELSEVIDGPDIHLRPEWANEEHTRIQWVMVHGTHAQPTIAQTWIPDWDATAEDSDVVDLDVTSDAAGMVSRVWGTGAGEGAGTVVVMAENLDHVQDGYPFLEKVISDPDQAKSGPIMDKALGELAVSQDPVVQVTLKVRADSEKNRLGRWRVGDAARLTLPDGWLTIPGGTYLMRIIKASGGLTNDLTVEFQTDQYGG